MTKITRFKDIPQFTRSGSWQCDFTIESLVKFVEENIIESGLQLSPKFQRGHVWTEEQQIAWLEYFLRGGKSGTVIYFNCPSWHGDVAKDDYNDYVCVDGLQRITAVQRFINNEIKVFGSYYHEYEDTTRIATHTLKINVNDLKTEEEVLRWYIDMNVGGTPHTDEEIMKVKRMLFDLEKTQ